MCLHSSSHLFLRSPRGLARSFIPFETSPLVYLEQLVHEILTVLGVWQQLQCQREQRASRPEVDVECSPAFDAYN